MILIVIKTAIWAILMYTGASRNHWVFSDFGDFAEICHFARYFSAKSIEQMGTYSRKKVVEKKRGLTEILTRMERLNLSLSEAEVDQYVS